MKDMFAAVCSLDTLGLRSGRATPLCPAGHLPLTGGDRLAVSALRLIAVAAFVGPHSSAVEMWHRVSCHRSPPLKGRCHAVTERGNTASRVFPAAYFPNAFESIAQ